MGVSLQTRKQKKIKSPVLSQKILFPFLNFWWFISQKKRNGKSGEPNNKGGARGSLPSNKDKKKKKYAVLSQKNIISFFSIFDNSYLKRKKNKDFVQKHSWVT